MGWGELLHNYHRSVPRMGKICKVRLDIRPIRRTLMTERNYEHEDQT